MRFNPTTILFLTLAMSTGLVTSHPATNDPNALMQDACPFKCKLGKTTRSTAIEVSLLT